MHRFIHGEDRLQQTLLPNSLEDYVSEENPVRVVEVFIDELDLAALGFSGMTPAATGRPAYHPSTLLKIYLYGYLNRVQSSRRLEREAQRNIELMWRLIQARVRSTIQRLGKTTNLCSSLRLTISNTQRPVLAAACAARGP